MRSQNQLLELDAKLTDSQKKNAFFGKLYEGGSETTAKAFSSVLTYIITDAFDLTGDEIVKVAYYVGETMKPLERISTHTIPPVVLEELKFARYSQHLFERSRSDFSSTEAKAPSVQVKTAPLSTWVEGFSEIIFNSYTNLNPMNHSRVVGSLHGLFKELGLDNDIRKSRPSLYLPNSIRALVH